MTDALKYDKNKPPMDLLPYSTLLEVAKVLGYGANKYTTEEGSGRHNWRKGFEYSRLHAAALRHIGAWGEGEDLDPESGINHIAHALCCLMFLLEHQIKGYGVDDRYPKQPRSNLQILTSPSLSDMSRNIALGCVAKVMQSNIPPMLVDKNE